MRITKVKLSPKRVSIEYEKERPGQDAADEFTLNCYDAPRPELRKALDSLRPFVLQICELPENLLDRVTVTGVSYSYGGEREVMGAVILAQMACRESGTVLNLNTPHLPSEPYGDDPLPKARMLPELCVEALSVLEDECVLYINGKREQGELPLESHDKAREEFSAHGTGLKAEPVTVEIDMGGKCSKCGKKGTGKSGLCLKCASDLALAEMR